MGFRFNMSLGSYKAIGISSAETLAQSKESASGLGETLGHSLMERIGNTPLLRLDALTRDLPGIALLGKAEWYNPGGSVKDRAAANIVAEGRRAGKLGPGKILLDATSGNTGIAYAMIGAALGLEVVDQAGAYMTSTPLGMDVHTDQVRTRAHPHVGRPKVAAE